MVGSLRQGQPGLLGRLEKVRRPTDRHEVASARPKAELMKKLESVAASIFGLAFLVLAIAVTAETVMRKVFNQSLQGVDELGGYILAIAGAMSFAVALVARAHIRIDIVHDHLPALLRVVLNVLASVSILVCTVAILRMAWFAYDESAALGATAQTP